jgi:hypothetical protein
VAIITKLRVDLSNKKLKPNLNHNSGSKKYLYIETST